MNKNSAQTLFALIIFLITLNFSCENDKDFSITHLPPDDRLMLITEDTTALEAFTRLGDSVVTYTGETFLLGSYYDEVFGLAKANYISQLRLLNTGNPNFGDYPEPDSLILRIAYNYEYDTDQKRNVRINNYGLQLGYQLNIYELNSPLPDSVGYYSNFQATDYYNPSNLLETRIIEDSDTLLKIAFPLSLAQRFLNAGANSADAYKSSASFSELVTPGFCFTFNDDSFNKGIYQFNLKSSYNVMTLYYNGTDSMEFRFDETCVHFNTYTHQYTENIQQAVVSTEPAEQVYLQGMEGLRTKILFPNIMSWAKTDTTIVRAELEIHYTEVNVLYPTPEQLYIAFLNENEQALAMFGYTTSTGYIGEEYDETKKIIRFNITDYINELLSGETEQYGLSIYPANRGEIANRAILNTADMKLRISYMPLKY